MQEIYRTKDIYEASWLYSKGAKFTGLQGDGHYYWFLFSSPKKSTALAATYWSQTAKGNIKHYADSFKTLRNLVLNKRDGDIAEGPTVTGV